jgi:hypothetical protein
VVWVVGLGSVGGFSQRVLNDLTRARLSRGRNDLAPLSPPSTPPPSGQLARPATHRKTEKERHIADGVGGGGRRGAES